MPLSDAQIQAQSFAAQAWINFDELPSTTKRKLVAEAEAYIENKRSGDVEAVGKVWKDMRMIVEPFTKGVREHGELIEALAAEMGINTKPFNFDERLELLMRAERLSTAKSRQEPHGCLSELRLSIKQRLYMIVANHQLKPDQRSA